MTLSRTSRIMLGLLLLSLAAFLWVNFLVPNSVLGLGFLRAASGDTPAAATPFQPTVAPVPESQVERDLEILDLPFLVTEPPPAEEAPAETNGADAPGDTLVGARRATVNPFSPILPGGGAKAAALPAPAPEDVAPRRTITEVPVPAAPAQGATPTAAAAPKAPPPSAVTPGSQATTTLPRALPGGTLGGTPQLLRSAIGATDPPAGDAGRQATVREPVQERTELQQAGEPAPSRSQPEPLSQPIPPQQADAAAKDPARPPLAAGTSSLSRYLRDNNVRFTGSVIGPVSVGVFRSSLTAAPVVISLGQTLPDTSIVLTDLRGQQAELSLGGSTQTLTLELRR